MKLYVEMNWVKDDCGMLRSPSSFELMVIVVASFVTSYSVIADTAWINDVERVLPVKKHFIRQWWYSDVYWLLWCRLDISKP